MAITLRGTKGSSLTHNELDQNFREYFFSASLSGSSLKLHKFTAISSSISVPLVNPVGRNGAIQFKLGSAVSGANAQFTGSQNLTFVEKSLKVTGSILLDTENEVGLLEVTGSGKITGNLTVGGTLTAEEFITERNTTIAIYNSGSTIFGDSQNDSHERTGSLKITGSFNLDGSGSVTSLSGSFSGSLQGEGSGITGIITSSFAISSSATPFTGITGKPTLISSSANLLTTASAAANVVTFTKGDSSTFTVTVATGSGGGGIASVVADTTPQLGGNLDLNAKTISGSGAINFVGNVNAISGSFTGPVSSSAINTLGVSVSGNITAVSGSFTGPVSASAINASGDITAFFSSDERLKDNVTPIESALDKLNQIGGYEFDWNSDSEHSGHDVGVIAQEIEKVLPEVVVTRGTGYKAVRYEKIVALLIQAIKEQQSQIDDLQSRL